jgi:hypothetical protein
VAQSCLLVHVKQQAADVVPSVTHGHLTAHRFRLQPQDRGRQTLLYGTLILNFGASTKVEAAFGQRLGSGIMKNLENVRENVFARCRACLLGVWAVKHSSLAGHG